MSTRAALKTEIMDDLRRSSAADGVRVLAAISAAIKFYQPKRLFFNESRYTFTTVASTSRYTMGSGADIAREFYRIDNAVVTDSASNNLSIEPTDYGELEVLIDGSAPEGLPRWYAYLGRALMFYPVPDDAYSIRLSGHIKLDEPEEDATEDNAWFTEAYELVRCRAKAYLYGHVWGDPGMAALMQEGERQALGALRSATTDKVMTGTLRPTAF